MGSVFPLARFGRSPVWISPEARSSARRVATDTALVINIRAPFLRCASLEKLPDHLAPLQTSPSPSNRYRIHVRRTHPVPPTDSTTPGHARVMDDAEKSEENEKESPPLQIYPKWYV